MAGDPRGGTGPGTPADAATGAGAGAPAETAIHVLGWPDLSVLTGELADRIRRDGTPQVLVGVLRGGLVPAVLLAHALGCRSVRAVEVVHTLTDAVGAAKATRPQVANPASLGDLRELDVLVVDDIGGSGDTAAVTCQLVAQAGARRVRTAVCLVNTANWQQEQPPQQALTYVGALVEGWVIFPWEQPAPAPAPPPAPR